MFDTQLRNLTAPAADRVARWLHQRGVPADAITVAGLVLGLASAASAGFGVWVLALTLWLTSRVLDGIDGAVARRSGPTKRGGFHDLMADFAVYAAFVVGVAVQLPEARVAAVTTLAAYYLSATAFLLWSSLDSDTQGQSDNRTVRFLGGLAEGFETIVAYAAICLFPQAATEILWVFAAMVAVTATQRIRFASASLARLDQPGG